MQMLHIFVLQRVVSMEILLCIFWCVLFVSPCLLLQVRFYLQPIGFILTFGTVCAKMWRVYYIFHNPTTKKKVIVHC